MSQLFSTIPISTCPFRSRKKITATGKGGTTVLMDPGSAFTLLLACPGGIPRSSVYVDFSASYDRIPHPDTKLEDSIDEIWALQSEKTHFLYNGKKFRYGGYTFHPASGGNTKTSVCLHLGLTDYRTFVGTNLSHLWVKFLVSSGDDPTNCQHTASPLGNGAIVETADKRILVLQRSHNVGEFPGYFVFPGGHSEPEELDILSHQTNERFIEQGVLAEKISQEMFNGIIREVVEEIGAPAESLSNPIFIGISRRDMNVRPTAFFFLNCNLHSHAVQQMYSRAQDGYESTQLYAVSTEDLLKMSERMPGCHRGGYALYEMMMKANRDD